MDWFLHDCNRCKVHSHAAFFSSGKRLPSGPQSEHNPEPTKTLGSNIFRRKHAQTRTLTSIAPPLSACMVISETKGTR